MLAYFSPSGYPILYRCSKILRQAYEGQPRKLSVQFPAVECIQKSIKHGQPVHRSVIILLMPYRFKRQTQVNKISNKYDRSV